MPLRVGWYIRDRILLIEVRGVITDEEFINLGNHPALLQAMDDSPAPLVHYFLRVRGKTQIEKHKKDGWSMLINFGMNPLWRMTATIIAQVGQGRFRFQDTHEDALFFMRRVDSSLPAQRDLVTDWFIESNWTVSV